MTSTAVTFSCLLLVATLQVNAEILMAKATNYKVTDKISDCAGGDWNVGDYWNRGFMNNDQVRQSCPQTPAGTAEQKLAACKDLCDSSSSCAGFAWYPFPVEGCCVRTSTVVKPVGDDATASCYEKPFAKHAYQLTKAVKFCLGANWAIGDVWQLGFVDGDTSKAHCPVVPVKDGGAVGKCQAACDHNSECKGFTWFPESESCCFRTDTSVMVKRAGSKNECFEKKGIAPSLMEGAAPTDAEDSADVGESPEEAVPDSSSAVVPSEDDPVADENAAVVDAAAAGSSDDSDTDDTLASAEISPNAMVRRQ